MKKLQVPMEDELLIEAKLYAIKNGLTLKDLVSEAITAYLTRTTTAFTTPTTTTTTNTTTKSSTSNTVLHTNTPTAINTNSKKTTPTTTNTRTKKKEVEFEVHERHINPLPKSEMEMFYGKVPTPHGKGEHDDDPLRYLDDEEEPTTIKPKKIEEEEVFKPFEY